jgi:NitT/TauT family transport system substrate-binding protein
MMSRALVALLAAACTGATTGATVSTPPPDAEASAPTFSLAWSEYPSWSGFGVAHEMGLINGKEGEMGPLEKKHNVDIVLREADYDTCIQMYGANRVDAAALTNMDSLPSSLGRRTVAVLPTSTSFGADAILTTKDITELAQLKDKKTYGLALTVSEYTFARNLQLKGLNPDEFTFSNMDPAAAATAMQQKQPGYDAIVVWNPFVLETLRKRDDVHVLADSTAIPGEIIDLIVVGQDALDKPGGDRFAAALIEAFYAVSDKIEAPDSRDATLVALGAKFSKLDAESMKTVVDQTRFYKTPGDATGLFGGDDLKQKMELATAFAVSRGIVKASPTLGYGSKADAPDAQFRFDPTYLNQVQQGR